MKKILSIASILALGIMLQASAVSAHVPIPGIDSGTLFQWPAGLEPEYYLGLGHENDESNLSFRVVGSLECGNQPPLSYDGALR